MGLDLCRAQRLSLRKKPKADNAAARAFIPHTSVGGAQTTAESFLTDYEAVPAKPERAVYGAQPTEKPHNNTQANRAGGGPAQNLTGLLHQPTGSSTAQRAQRSTGTAPGILEAMGRPAFAPAARKGSATQAWVPRRRNLASFDALDDLPDLSGHQQAKAGKPSRDPPVARQPDLAGCQPSQHCSEALRPLKSSLNSVAPSSRDDHSAPGGAQDIIAFAQTAASTALGRLQYGDSHSSALQPPSKWEQPDMSESAKPGSPSGASMGSKLPQCTMEASDRAKCNVHAVPCASAAMWAVRGREHQLQPATMTRPHWKPFAAPRPAGKPGGGEPSSAVEAPAHAAQGLGSQGSSRLLRAT